MFSSYDWWGFGAGIAALFVPLSVLAYNQVKASKWGQHHDGIIRVWGLAEDIATQIVTQIGPNPASATKATVIAAGVDKLKTVGAQALSQIIGGTSDATLTELLTTKVNAQSVAATAAAAVTQAAQAASTASAAATAATVAVKGS